MNFRNLFTCCIFIVLCCNTANAQASDPMDNLPQFYKDCLVKGTSMVKCSRTYYREIDSTLRVTYQQLVTKMDTAARLKLKKDQSKWVESKNRYFEQISHPVKEPGLTDDETEVLIVSKKIHFFERTAE